MRIVWTSRAIGDLIEIREYVSKDKPVAAERLAQKIISSAEVLARHTHLGRPGREPGTRELLVAGTPYVLPYKFTTTGSPPLPSFTARESGLKEISWRSPPPA